MSNERHTDEWHYGYDEGWIDGVNNYKIATRVAAFGAVRRAAEVARDVERCKEFYACDSMEPYRWFWRTDVNPIDAANAIRLAIRAAIGSEKAS